MRFGINARLYTLVALFGLGCAALAGILSWMAAERAVHDREQGLERLVDVAIATLDVRRKQAEAAGIPEAEAKKQALAEIAKLRFDATGYYFVFADDGQLTMLVNDPRPDILGQPQISVKDKEGWAFNVDMAKMVAATGKGLVRPFWTKPGSDGLVRKSMFSKAYAPWKMIVGTGVYDDDLAAQTHAILIQAALITGVLLLVMVGIAAWMARGIALPLRAIRTAMAELADYRPISVVLDRDRKDELGEMARAVEVFRENAEARLALEGQTAEQRRAGKRSGPVPRRRAPRRSGSRPRSSARSRRAWRSCRPAIWPSA